ncbi:hypothetical protein HETIRDRAFT_119272 [Heterobasidion irregulare TC 32-1]|uniref:Uncharacterized protein n=1 Tax=Heterobasidion irregulare (strain TC 32-1) TaxID=747525 RepID=W4JSD1_HETIT|nr:uncharacterized protein HETIRDRAFT_119272 [Heterobasidion irregulare TC 32-1]ETW76015.1 hypothetical protein HETIRDRAFT_119272 [Heterobasidion irregulare TC 32-1]
MVQTKNIREISHTIESLLVLDCFILQLLKIYNTLDLTKDASKREEASQFGSVEGSNIPRPVTDRVKRLVNNESRGVWHPDKDMREHAAPDAPIVSPEREGEVSRLGFSKCPRDLPLSTGLKENATVAKAVSNGFSSEKSVAQHSMTHSKTKTLVIEFFRQRRKKYARQWHRTPHKIGHEYFVKASQT